MKAQRVLMVDDDPEICQFLSTLLELEGISSIVANRPEEAFEAVKQEGLAAVLMDIAMPGLDGLELCKQIRSQGVRVPILILSARPGAELPRKAAQAGANEFIRKPFDNSELMERLRYWMQQPVT